MNQIENDTHQIEFIKKYFNELRKVDNYIVYEDSEKEIGMIA